jgi:hypothetical protein
MQVLSAPATWCHPPLPTDGALEIGVDGTGVAMDEGDEHVAVAAK